MYMGYEAFILPLTFRQFISWEVGATDSYRLMEKCHHGVCKRSPSTLLASRGVD